LDILAQGPGFVAIAKPPGRIVVPGRGEAAREPTLRDELAARLGTPVWVVHRLDRGTSGVLLFATDPDAHRALSRAFERRAVTKRYWALVRGHLLGGGEIDLALQPVRGGRVRTVAPAAPGRGAAPVGAKASQTIWRAMERCGAFTVLELRPQTGRLHQIRAHLAAIGHPLAVDPAYGGADRLTVGQLGRAGGDDRPSSQGPGPRGPGPDAVVLDRTPLHAASLKFPAPDSGKPVEVFANLPQDLVRAITILREDGQRAALADDPPGG